MAQWVHRLALKDLFTEEEDPATVKRVATEVHARLVAFQTTHYPENAILLSIVEDFESVADEPEPDLEWFNAVMDDLYDWGDHAHRLWIE